jgi:hypothetical protein
MIVDHFAEDADAAVSLLLAAAGLYRYRCDGALYFRRMTKCCGALNAVGSAP